MPLPAGAYANVIILMQEPEEIIWENITDSAKRRFDYLRFSEGFAGFDGHVPENVLLKVLVGLAQGDSTSEIVTGISREFLLLGLGMDEAEMEQFVNLRKEDLKVEIRATDIALTLLDQGRKPPGVLVQIRSILESAQTPSRT